MIPDGGVFQDFSLVLVPGMRLSCLARAAARSVRRSARTGEAGAQAEQEQLQRPTAQAGLRHYPARTSGDEGNWDPASIQPGYHAARGPAF
ncbi:MAG TPA: hypothetical protein VGL19_14220, partial [Polyangiaceae bacterium]